MGRGKTQGVQTALYEFAELLNVCFITETDCQDHDELCSLQHEAEALFQSEGTENTFSQPEESAQQREENEGTPDIGNVENVADVLCASQAPSIDMSEDFLSGI